MISAAFVSLLLLADDPGTVVLVGRRTGLSQTESQVLAQTISTHLREARVPVRLDATAASTALGRMGLKDASACNGRKACLTELGRQLESPWVISLSLSRIDADLSIAVELVRVADGQVVEKDAMIIPVGAKPTADQFAAFATKANTHFPAKADAPRVEAPPPPPEKPDLVPPPPPPEVVSPVLPPPVAKSRTTPIILGSAAVVAIGVGTALLISGLNTRADAYTTLDDGGVLRSPYPASVVQQKASSGAVQLGVAGALGAVGLGLGTAAVLTW